MSGADSIAQARDGLLAVIAADREARCRAILAPAEEAAATRVAAAVRAARSALRRGLVSERAAMHAQLDSARAQQDAAVRERHQRIVLAVVAEGWPLLVAALALRWGASHSRERWIAEALDAACARLPPRDWCIRHPPGLSDADAEAMGRRLAAQGIVEVRCEAAAEIAAGIEIRAGAACLDATAAGLLADRAAVAGRLVQLWEAAAAPDAGGEGQR